MNWANWRQLQPAGRKARPSRSIAPPVGGRHLARTAHTAVGAARAAGSDAGRRAARQRRGNVPAMLRQVLSLNKLIDELYALARADVGELAYKRQRLDLWQLPRAGRCLCDKRSAAGARAGTGQRLPAPALMSPTRTGCARSSQFVRKLHPLRRRRAPASHSMPRPTAPVSPCAPSTTADPACPMKRWHGCPNASTGSKVAQPRTRRRGPGPGAVPAHRRGTWRHRRLRPLAAGRPARDRHPAVGGRMSAHVHRRGRAGTGRAGGRLRARRRLPPSVFGDGGEALAALRAACPICRARPDAAGSGWPGAVPRVRQFSEVPIIMVTARVEEVDRLLGLEIAGRRLPLQAVQPRELMARIKVILRRTQKPGAPSSRGAGRRGWRGASTSAARRWT
jgi:hypothetical protein